MSRRISGNRGAMSQLCEREDGDSKVEEAEPETTLPTSVLEASGRPPRNCNVLKCFLIHYVFTILHTLTPELRMLKSQTECKQLAYLVSAIEISAETIRRHVSPFLREKFSA